MNDYADLEVKKFRPIGEHILVDWEEKTKFIKIGKNKKALIRSQFTKKQHYTGIVLKIGGDVEDNGQIKVGERIFFEQFSGFAKAFDPEFGRLAIIKEPHVEITGLDKRMRVESEDGDYDWDS